MKKMSTVTLTALGIVIAWVLFMLIIVGMCFSTYNRLVDLEENVNLAAANVQTMLQRRLELIPDLVEITKEAAAHEEKIYKDIENARVALSNCVDSNDFVRMGMANEQLTTAINKLLVIVESYPTITASQQYTSLMDQLEGSVNRISIAREEYNLAVSSYNRVIRKMPGSIIAGMFGFAEKEWFVANEAANDTSIVDFSK